VPVSIYIDHNVWHFLFDRKLDLSLELPKEDFCLCLTREAEFEIPPIPQEKSDLKTFIEETVKKCTIETRRYFGFSDPAHPATEQRVGGFGRVPRPLGTKGRASFSYSVPLNSPRAPF
jgi:hypothetical protein